MYHYGANSYGLMVIMTPSCYARDFIYQSFDSDFNLSGTIGHVAHGKSTVVKAISGVQVSSVIFNK